MKYYAIKRPDGEWMMNTFSETVDEAWMEAAWLLGDPWTFCRDNFKKRGYTCVEVSGFVEVGK